MTKRFRVHDWVKFNYSEIREYIGEGYTDRPLRNDVIVDLLNELAEENEQLKETINVQNECIQELEDWFKKYGYDNVNFEVLDNIMESYLND